MTLYLFDLFLIISLENPGDQELGSLAAGKLADLIILSANPLKVDPDELLDIQVVMTMVGGQVEYCSPGQEVYCP